MRKTEEGAKEWSSTEVDQLIEDYLSMLDCEIAGVPYNKARRNRDLRARLTSRSRGAVEFKHCNLSAVLKELGYRHIEGYKPRRNYQWLLRERLEQRLRMSDVSRYQRPAK